VAIRVPASTTERNSLIGKDFEKLFIRQAKLNGLWAYKNKLNCILDWRGRPRLVESPLDFRLVNDAGRVGFFDTKHYQGDSFPYSKLSEHQIDQAHELNYWNVPAGFVVMLESTKRVFYYSGILVKSCGPRSSFSPENGLLLGRIEDFNLKLLLD